MARTAWPRRLRRYTNGLAGTIIFSEPGLKTFTIVDWTSSSRQIANSYTLIFTLRTDDGVISPDEAKTVWHGILEETLKGEDLKKLGAGD